MQSLLPHCHYQEACHSRLFISLTLINSKELCVPETWTMTCSLFPNVTHECQFWDHLLSRPLLTRRALSWETWTVALQSIFTLCHHRVACLFQMSPEYSSINWRVLCPRSHKQWPCKVSFPVSPKKALHRQLLHTPVKVQVMMMLLVIICWMSPAYVDIS